MARSTLSAVRPVIEGTRMPPICAKAPGEGKLDAEAGGPPPIGHNGHGRDTLGIRIISQVNLFSHLDQLQRGLADTDFVFHQQGHELFSIH